LIVPPELIIFVTSVEIATIMSLSDMISPVDQTPAITSPLSVESYGLLLSLEPMSRDLVVMNEEKHTPIRHYSVITFTICVDRIRRLFVIEPPEYQALSVGHKIS